MVLTRFLFIGIPILVLNACSTEQVSDSTTVDESNVVVSGKKIYDNNCMACHGSDGKLGAGGALDLSTSKMSTEEMSTIIDEGRNGMPPHKHVCKTQEEKDSLVSFVLNLRVR